MKYLITAIALLVLGCDSTDTSRVEVPNGEIITLDENQTVGYLPNTDVQIVNVGDGSYYISCNEGSECPIHIGDVDESSQSTTTSNTDATTVYDAVE